MATVKEQRRVAVVTSLGRKYSGLVDLPNVELRTTDLFNSSNIYWKNPNERCFDNAVLMSNVIMSFDDSSVYREFDNVQLRLSEVFYFYDYFQAIGDEKEKKRAAAMIAKTQENLQRVNIITREFAGSFYDIQGNFYGLFRKKSHGRFIPLTDVKMSKIHREANRWVEKKVTLPCSFICISTSHIEAVTIG